MISSVALAVVLGLALIGAIAALVFTEVRSRSGVPPRPAPAAVTGRDALNVIDLGLRSLAAECMRAGRALPDVYAVVLSGDRLTLRLSGADPEAPPPWTTDDSGEEWSAGPAQLGGTDLGVASDAAHPYALTVTIGLDRSDRVMVELSRASAAISVTGDGGDVRKLVRALVAELITGPVGRHAEVTLVGSAATAEMTLGLGLQSTRLHTVATLREALAQESADARASAASGAASPVTQVFRLIEGSSPVIVQGRAPRLFVLDAAQFRDEKEAMTHLNATDALLVLGDVPDYGWRFRIGDDGSLDTGPLGLRVGVHAGRLS
ncbi:hypothetical protein [Streptomyces sp. NPDC005407]|uniref:hypothetical protein n=1 Tax=Streptomyces sp. NPDC005407 TaxID=3155340 RepID=UPI0033AB6D63